MPNIQVLDPHVADLIAAGEVVERPASVAKELMENAIDAGASAITVEIRHGGLTFLRVTDNGCGIPREELKTAFLRHATSKLRTEYDLEAIGTLGFRGEALAAISAVSRLDVMSRTADAPLGASLTLEGGVPGAVEEAGCPLGTTMVVRDLFYNTPARLKFMKKDAAEGAAVFAAVQHIALSHPEVSVKFIRDGKQEMLTPGDGQARSALYAVLGRELALGYLKVGGSGEGMEVTGFVSRPTCCRGSRSSQHFFVNGRYVKSRTMMAALEEAYQNQKMVGRFPGCVLYLTIRLSTVDVNVHPAKTEVKFGSERAVFQAVYHAVRAALEGEHSHPRAVLPEESAPRQTALPGIPRPAAGLSGQTRLSVADVRGSAPAAAGGVRRAAPTPPRPSAPSLGRTTSPLSTAPRPNGAKEAENRADAPKTPVEKSVESVQKTRPAPAAEGAEGTTSRPAAAAPAPGPETAPAAEPVPPTRTAPAAEVRPAPEEEAVQQALTPPQAEEPWRVAGEVFHTYILVEQGDRMLLIDKHAAHERMNFDRMKAEGYQPMSQQLLTPAVCRVRGEERAALLEHQGLLSEFGFEVEEFPGDALMVRQAPFDLDVGDIEDTLLELAGRLLTAGGADPQGARDELLHTMACKAAIKGGWKSGPQELEQVARAVLSGAVKYCPHGRPVAIELTKKQLEKQFKRA